MALSKLSRTQVLELHEPKKNPFSHALDALRAPLPWLALLLLLILLWPRGVLAIEKVDTGSILNSSGRVRFGPGIAAVGAMVIGAIVCLFGYRLLRPAIFLCGFLSGGLLVALIIEYAFGSMSWVALASWIGFLVGGLICGCLVLMMYNMGLFLIGALAGALLAFTLNTAFMYRLYPSQPDAMLVILIIVLGLIGGLLAWKVEKPVIILATAFIGADALVWGVGYFAGKYPSGADLKRFRYQDAHGDWIYKIPKAWWAYLVALIVIFLFGTYWQFRRSGKDVSYTSSSDSSSPVLRTATASNSRGGGTNERYGSTVTPRQSDSGNPISHV